MQEIRHVDIRDVLRARDERVERQNAFLRRHGCALISFTMNVAGSIKRDALIERAFREGQRRIARELERMSVPVPEFCETLAFTGCECLWAADGDAQTLKQRMCAIEEQDELGRLFDIDVIAPDGSHLSRMEERRCLICGGPVRVCARSRTHSAEELYQKTHGIIRRFFEKEQIRQIGEWAQKALLFEAVTTPKPGLVDCENSGSHTDMDLFSFMASAAALRPYFEDCVRLGLEHADVSRLQHRGRLAEEEMLRAAHANTHKGAIFSLGILCYAMGEAGENAPMDAVLASAAKAGAHFLKQLESARSHHTGGERQYRDYGLTGARGEAASGFDTVRTVALPVLKQELEQGKSLNDAGLEALLALMARLNDSNIILRAGMDAQAWVMEEARQSGDLREMNRRFVRRRISPGGSADLLAAAYFLHFAYA